MQQPAIHRADTVGSSLGSTLSTHRVLRNTYALLSMTLLFSAAVAGTAVALRLPAPGILITLAGYFIVKAINKGKQANGKNSETTGE